MELERQVEKLKWQIHAETSISQIMLWCIVIILVDNIFIDVLGFTLILCNGFTLLKSCAKLGTGYFK